MFIVCTRTSKASQDLTCDYDRRSEGARRTRGRASVPQEIRDEDMLIALEKVAVGIPRNRPASRCGGVLLQGDCGNAQNPRGNSNVQIESRKEAAAPTVGEVARSYGINPRTKKAGAAETA